LFKLTNAKKKLFKNVFCKIFTYQKDKYFYCAYIIITLFTAVPFLTGKKAVAVVRIDRINGFFLLFDVFFDSSADGTLQKYLSN